MLILGSPERRSYKCTILSAKNVNKRDQGHIQKRWLFGSKIVTVVCAPVTKYNKFKIIII